MELLIIVFIVGLFATGYAVYWVCLAAFVLVFGIIGSLFGAAAGRPRGYRSEWDRLDWDCPDDDSERVPGRGARILLAAKPVDFRKGHDGLAALVVFVFRAKR